MKGVAIDHTGREVSVVWVKASGADLASIKEPGFPALALDDLRRHGNHPLQVVSWLRRREDQSWSGSGRIPLCELKVRQHPMSESGQKAKTSQ